MSDEPLTTKTTLLAPSLWGCRVIWKATGKPVMEVRVESKTDIASAYADMLRWIDKSTAIISPMAVASRHRQKPHKCHKIIWYSDYK